MIKRYMGVSLNSLRGIWVVLCEAPIVVWRPGRLFLGSNTEFSCLPKTCYVVSVSEVWAHLKLLRGPFLKPSVK